MNPVLSASRRLDASRLDAATIDCDRAEECRIDEECGRADGEVIASDQVRACDPPAVSKVFAHTHLLWSCRRLLRRAAAAGLGVGALIALLIPARYQSTVQLMPPDNTSNNGMAMLAAMAAKSTGGMGAMAGDVLGIKSSGALFVGILRSRTVEDRLVERFELKKVYGVRLDEDARRELSQNTAVGEDRKSGIISLTVDDRDRQRARAMAEAYVHELNRLVAELSTSSAHRERVFLEDRLAAVKQDLDQASRALGEFSSRNATLDVKDEGRAMVEAAASLQGALIAAESHRQALEAIYTPSNVRVRAAAAQAAELRKQLEKLGGQAPGPEPEGREKSDSIYPSLRKFPLLGIEYEDLFRRAKIEEAVFETLTQQYEIAKVQEAKETPTVKMLDEANMPGRRSFPPRTLIALLGSGLAFLGASALVIARRRWEQTEEGDARKRFALEIAASVNSVMPWSPPNGSRWHRASHRVWVGMMGVARLGGAQSEVSRGNQHGSKTLRGKA